MKLLCQAANSGLADCDSDESPKLSFVFCVPAATGNGLSELDVQRSKGEYTRTGTTSLQKHELVRELRRSSGSRTRCSADHDAVLDTPDAMLESHYIGMRNALLTAF